MRWMFLSTIVMFLVLSLVCWLRVAPLTGEERRAQRLGAVIALLGALASLVSSFFTV